MKYGRSGIYGYYMSILEGKRGFSYAVAKPGLFLGSLLYGLVVKARFFLYEKGLFKSETFPCRVISVGNLVAGGAGKTPVVIMLAKMLAAGKKKAVIVSRGYGRTAKRGRVTVVTDGKRMLVQNPGEAGDEPFMMAQKLEGVPVVVCGDKLKACRHAVKEFSPDFIILDDGFQSLKLSRWLGLLVLNCSNPFGNCKLLPAGFLREPVKNLRRAGLIMLTRCEQASAQEKEALLKIIAEHCGGVQVIECSYAVTGMSALTDNETRDAESLKGAEVTLVSGIGMPGSFEHTVKSLGADKVRVLAFPDHHRYDSRDVERIEKAAGTVVTTEKDGVSLKGAVKRKIWVLKIEAQITKGREALVSRLFS